MQDPANAPDKDCRAPQKCHRVFPVLVFLSALAALPRLAAGDDAAAVERRLCWRRPGIEPFRRPGREVVGGERWRPTGEEVAVGRRVD
jgi:hypothetical protein